MRSLKRALLAYILGGVSLIVVVSGIAVFITARTTLRTQFDQALVARARTLGGLVIEENGVLEFEYDGPLHEAEVGALVRITGDDGTTIVQSPEWPPDRARSEPAPGGEPVLLDLELDDTPRRAVALATFAAKDPGFSSGESADTSDRVVVVEVIGRTDTVRRAESAILAALVVGGLFAVIGSTVAVWLGIGRGLHPVRELGSAVDRIDTRELTMPAPRRPYPDELRPIISALEGLLNRLRAAMDRERRFTDAAAHELRTPIAELKTITDVADRWPEPERLQRSVKDARGVIGQMEDLLESLLAAARGGGCESPSIEDVALLPLVRTVADEAVDRSGRRRLTWTFEGDEQAVWKGPRGVVVAIVRNLIENAAEYTPEGGGVRISATTNGQATVLEVENGPVALDPSKVDRLFEPFWRADASRSDRDHRGLGLNIVASLADALDLRREAVITTERRLRVRLAS